jgi:hypothetical protein
MYYQPQRTFHPIVAPCIKTTHNPAAYVIQFTSVKAFVIKLLRFNISGFHCDVIHNNSRRSLYYDIY